MSILLVMAFLFYVGSIVGYILEVLFRKIFYKQRKWVNTGFLIGPYEPIYGWGLIILFGISLIDLSFVGSKTLSTLFEIILMAIGVTMLEYVTGLIFNKCLRVKLWDYSDRWGNVQGLICPVYSFMWTAVCVIYYFFINPHIINAVIWFTNNITFSFFIGFFFGILFIDLTYNCHMVVKIRKYAKANGIYIDYHLLKEKVAEYDKAHGIKTNRVFPLGTNLAELDKKLEYYKEHMPKVSKVVDSSVEEV